jgi:hypothetical protein
LALAAFDTIIPMLAVRRIAFRFRQASVGGSACGTMRYREGDARENAEKYG